MKPESDPEFDAVAAAAELEEALAQAPDAPPSAQQEQSYIDILEAEVAQLTELVAQKDELVRRASERADRAQREVEAAKQRLAAASAKELEQRTRKLLHGFLDVLDDLDRAIEATRKMDHNPEVLAGVELVRKELLAHLAQLGVTHLPALGELFDPTRHEAMAAVPVTDPAQDNRIIGVVREGYAIGDDILRPAGVAVGKLRA